MARRIKKNSHYTLHKLMKGNIMVPLLFLVVVGFAVMVTSGTLVNKSATDPNEQFGEAQVESGTGKQNLQLKNVSFQPKPTPVTDTCNHDMSTKADPEKCDCIAQLVKCEGGKCVDYNPEKSTPKSGTKEEICTMFDQNNWCQIFSKEGDGWYCIGKPVIYLYPEKTMPVSVKVQTAGEIVVSDPLYPEGGWNVVANPNGNINYKNLTYRELFYETSTQDVRRPKSGIVISKQNIKAELLDFITKLGLTHRDEQQEFLDWWIPRLNNLKTDKIFASILEDDEKLRLDKVLISPKPDTMIEFIAYFAPLSDNETVIPLFLPTAPERVGFTAVEWGGVIGD